MNRLQWFKDRVGKKVYRNEIPFDSSLSIKNGILVTCSSHAEYLYMIECDFNAEGIKLRYFDTHKEVIEFEANN